MAIPYRLRESIPVWDEADLVIKLLKTNLRNHRLKHILPYENIVKEEPDMWRQFPGIYVRKVSNVSMIEYESLGEDYDTGDDINGYMWESDIQFDIVAHVKQIFNYPPIVTDGEDASIRYEHAKNCLPKLHSLLHVILSENRKFVDPDDATFQWDSVEPGDYRLIDGNYGRSRARDVWAIECIYRFQFEKVIS